MEAISVLFNLQSSMNDSLNLLDALNTIRSAIVHNKEAVELKLIKEPFSLYQHTTDKYPHTRVSRHRKKEFDVDILGPRVFLVNKSFIYKNDEQPHANELSFIATLFAKACGVLTPSIILTELPYFIEDGNVYKINDDVGAVQVVQYFPKWKDYTPHDLPNKQIKQLARLLAFDLTICNEDRFLFVFRYIANILYADDESYEEVDVWDEPIINEGNFGTVDSSLDLWSIDMQSTPNLEYIEKIHALIKPSFTLHVEVPSKVLRECCVLMGEHFELSPEQLLLFTAKVDKYLRYNLEIYPVYARLYNWIMNSK